MRTKDDSIELEADETERCILRALAIASYELSRPAKMIKHRPAGMDLTLAPDRADRFIHEANPVLNMQQVDGCDCRTIVTRLQLGGCYTLDWSTFVTWRGHPGPVYYRARQILAGETGPVPIELIVAVYRGPYLDTRLQPHGMHRKSGERDWELRKRAFVGLFHKDRDLACAVLMGTHRLDGDPDDWTAIDTLLRSDRHDMAALYRFAEAFPSDPQQNSISLHARQQRLAS